MSGLPQRTNIYTAEPVSDRTRQCLFDWLAAHAPLWNQLTYRRRQAYFDEDGDVWDVEYTDLYDDYAPILGTATCQQLARKNSEAWRGHFRALDRYHDDTDSSVTDRPSPPGYWGNRDDGYELHGLVRNDLYTIDWDEQTSTLEFGVGKALKTRYDLNHRERLTLELEGTPRWDGADGRLELTYDEAADTIRVHHPSAFGQINSANSDWMDLLTHSTPRTRLIPQPSTSVPTTPSPSSLTRVTQPSIMPAGSSSGSSNCQKRSRSCSPRFPTVNTPVDASSAATTNGRESVTTVATRR